MKHIKKFENWGGNFSSENETEAMEDSLKDLVNWGKRQISKIKAVFGKKSKSTAEITDNTDVDDVKPTHEHFGDHEVDIMEKTLKNIIAKIKSKLGGNKEACAKLDSAVMEFEKTGNSANLEKTLDEVCC